MLQQGGIGRPVILLDLDRVDHNLGWIHHALGDRLRVVTKSLPSVPLLRYIMGKTNSRKLMAFHVRFLPMLLKEFPEAEILMGKPLLAASIAEFYSSTDHPDPDIQWLIDSRERLEELTAIAPPGRQLKFSIEIDVGLHRGGLDAANQVTALLEAATRFENLVFCGFMGYEAHVPYYPDPDAAFDRAMSRYQELAAAQDAGTLNSGGSSTYYRFADVAAINDVSVGSAFVKPAAFNALEEHEAALVIAAPVLKRFNTVSRSGIPEEKAISLYLYGGGWPGELLAPPGVAASESNDPPNSNLLPNQSLYYATTDNAPEIGDFVYFQPQQSDAMFQFDSIFVHRSGVLVDNWPSFREKY